MFPREATANVPDLFAAHVKHLCYFGIGKAQTRMANFSNGFFGQLGMTIEMCMVSVVSVAGSAIPSYEWTRPVFNEYQEILKRLADLDTKLGQPDCVDPAKEAWMRDVEARLKRLEALEAAG